MRIAISTSVIQRGKSGIGQYLTALVRALEPYAREHEFSLLVLEDDLPLLDFARGFMRLVSVPERFRPPLRNLWWHQTALPAWIARQGVDLLHVPSYRRLVWHRACALVGTIHDLAPFRLSAKYNFARMIFGRVVAKRLAHRQDRIIAVSRSTANDIQRYFGLGPECVTVVLNGVDHARFCPGPAEAAKAWMAERHGVREPFFLYVARLEHPGKNHVRLIDAFGRFKRATGSRWSLVLGGADWHGAEVIHAAARSSPSAASIHCLGFVPDSDLPDLYRAADVFVFPSLHEGFGLPIVEAMACGCPVISSARGSLAEIAENAAVIIDPENVASLQQELGGLAADPEQRDRWRAAGRRRAMDFDWHITAKATLDVYGQAVRQNQNVLATRRPSPHDPVS